MDPGPVPRVGVGRADRDLRRALPDAEGAPRGDDRAHAQEARPRRARGGRRPDERPEGRAAPDLQRVLDRRRRDRSPRLRELRRARGLRGARSPGHLRQGGDRHRPLRPLLARHQAEGGGRARGDRLPHLLGPAGRRLLRGRRVSEGPDAPEGRRAARQRHGHAVLDPGDPLTPGVGATKDAKRLDREGRAQPHPDSRPADLLRRCPAPARGARGAGGPRRLSGGASGHRTTWARGRRRSI